MLGNINLSVVSTACNVIVTLIAAYTFVRAAISSQSKKRQLYIPATGEIKKAIELREAHRLKIGKLFGSGLAYFSFTSYMDYAAIISKGVVSTIAVFTICFYTVISILMFLTLLYLLITIKEQGSHIKRLRQKDIESADYDLDVRDRLSKLDQGK